jgi:uncharacterized SAM-binding protein YcdF (DUF218 family)
VTQIDFSKRPWFIPAVIYASLLFVGIVAFFEIGNWLTVEDPLAHADVIVVLSGRLPERAIEASRIFHAGFASQVWISQPDAPVDALKAMKIDYLGEDFYNEKVLISKGVPLEAIHILERPCANTEEEIKEISETMRTDGFHNAIVVTSKPHTRRVRSIWRKLADPELHSTVRFPMDDPFDGGHWWRRSGDALDVVREVLGLMNATAGFPLRPGQT